MNILWAIIVGLVAGYIAGKIVEGHGLGIMGNIVVGILGAVIGNIVFRYFDIAPNNIWGDFITATVGAIILLIIVDAIRSGLNKTDMRSSMKSGTTHSV
ncbi:MAG: GlsB/YeaQ/YmgE family stress response membrane protein [Candidatus Kerfeldbacteria bacterium]|nr:GlsB/YeaQ/YmgE family stress response membrane protein [Candidatus Kerfeldbacteria bacterium]